VVRAERGCQGDKEEEEEEEEEHIIYEES